MNEVSAKLLRQLENETKFIRQLDPEKATHREAVYAYLKEKPSKVKNVNLDNSVEKLFLDKCFERDYKLFLSLSPEQYKEEYSELYNELYNANPLNWGNF